jgi:hypothetical protein
VQVRKQRSENVKPRNKGNYDRISSDNRWDDKNVAEVMFADLAMAISKIWRVDDVCGPIQRYDWMLSTTTMNVEDAQFLVIKHLHTSHHLSKNHLKDYILWNDQFRRIRRANGSL